MMSETEEHPKLAAVLDGIRARAGQAHPPLYAYRVTDAELAAIEHALRGRIGQPGGVGRLEEAAFCVYGAEIFCRHHVDGQWQWRTIIERLGVEHATRWLYPAVARGLAWWGREVMQIPGSRQFLVSLACEGGLPLELVRSRSTALGSYASRVLSDREAFGSASAATTELARFHAGRLPRTLRNDTVFELVAALVDRLVELRRSVPDGIERPRVWLERHRPDWTDALPLRVDDTQGRALLDLLLGQPRGESTPGADVHVSASLRQTSHGWRLTRALELPRTLTTEALKGVLADIDPEFKPDALGPFVRFALVDAHGERRVMGEAREGFDHKHYRFDTFGVVVRDDAGPLALWVHVGPRVIARGTPSGGGPMPDEPWIFADGGEMTLLGTGSLRTRAPAVLVAIDASDGSSGGSSAPTADEADGIDGTRVSLGEVAGRRLVRVSGRWAFGEPGAQFVVRTRAEDELREVFDLRGSSLPLGPGGAPVWRGLPAVVHRPLGAPAREIPPRSLELSSAGRVWLPVSGQPAGALRLRWVEGGEVRFMRRVLVAPRDFEVEVRPGPGPREGRVRLRGVPGARLGVVPGETFACEVHPDAAGVAAQVQWQGDLRPDTLAATLRLGPPHDSDIPLRLPFPVPFVGFVGREGIPLARGVMRRLDQLSTIRAQVRAVHAGDAYGVWARVKGHRWRYLMALRPEGERAFTLGLDAVRERVEVLQARTIDLDCAVQLTIRVAGGVVRPGEPRLYVRRYAQTLEPSTDPETPGRRLLTCHQAEGDRLRPPDRVDLRPLWSPAAAPVRLPGQADGGWTLEDADFEPGPWLAVGWRGDLAVTRPLLVTLGGAPEAGGDVHGSLAALVRAPREQRHAAMYSLFVELAADPGSSKWGELRDMLAEVGNLPANTFDVVCGLIEHQDTLALAGVKMGDHEAFAAFWEGMESLPFTWSLVPVDVWLEAARSEQRRLEREAGALTPALDPAFVAELAARALRVFGENLGARRPAMRVMLEVLHTAGLPVPAPEEPVFRVATLVGDVPLKAARDAALQALLRTQAIDDSRDAYWPQLAADELDAIKGALKAPESVFDDLRLDARGRPYRRSVLDAPVIAAIAAAWGHRLDPAHVFALRILRSFDERWFDEAYVFTLALALADRARRDLEFLP